MKVYKVETERDNPYPSLDFEDIGRMKGMARWMDTTEKYHPSTPFLTSNWYNDTAYNSESYPEPIPLLKA